MNISALDENGKAVNWWFAYKVPKMAKAANSPTATEFEYGATGIQVQNIPQMLLFGDSSS